MTARAAARLASASLVATWPAERARASGTFIGRAGELAAIGARFAAGARLVTLIGPGGVGKTRLAQEYARATAQKEGSVFCELEDARDVADVHVALLRALGVPAASATADPAEQTARVLAARGSLLVVLDNFEQVVRAAPAVARWMAEAPGARFLATSRLPLRVAGEIRFPVQPLNVPTAHDAPCESEAVLLFLDRVRASGHGQFVEGDASVARVAELVRRLDGIPLAIELAAARIGVLDIEGLLERAPRQLEVLGRGARDEATIKPARARGTGSDLRHATLRSAIEWSYRLLEPDARRALAQCAVFRGGFPIEAAEGVLEFDGGEPGRAVLDALQALRDHSLLCASSKPGERLRFHFFEAIREFGTDMLRSSGEEARVRERHAAHFARVAHSIANAERMAAPLGIERYLAERENLTVAFEHELASPKVGASSRVLGLAIALDVLLSAEGAPARRIEILGAALAGCARKRVDAGLLSLAHRARGRALCAAGRLGSAARDLALAERTARRARDLRLQGAILLDRGVALHARREIREARRCYERALDIHTRTGVRAAEGRTLGNLGALYHDIGRFEDARVHYKRALAIFREVGDARLEGIFLTNLAVLDVETERPEDARPRFERATRLLSFAADSRLLAIAEGNFGMLHHELGDPSAAREMHERAARALRAVGDIRSEGLALARLAAAHAEMGLADDARHRLDESEALLARVDDPQAQHVVALARALLGVLPAGGPSRHAAPRIREAREAMNRARWRGPRRKSSAADLSDDVRAMLRVLEKAVARVDPAEAAGVVVPEGALAIGPDAAWFRPPGGRWQDLRRHGAQRVMLQALVSRHRSRGPALSLDALRETAWPGLKLQPEAANHRVYVALSSLRARGLSRCLRRDSEGYRLEVGLEVVVVDTPPPEAPARRRPKGTIRSGKGARHDHRQ
jgi:predicted ATPase